MENIIVVYEGKNHSKHKVTPNDSFKLGEYFFSIPHITEHSHLYSDMPVTLVDKKYKDFDAKFSESPLIKLKIHKSFVRKNKKRVLSIEKMREMGYEKIFELFRRAKHIFLIDLKKKDGKLLTLKEVLFFYVASE